MIKAAFLLILVFTTVIQSNNLIPWNATRKLAWSDFTGNIDPHSTNAALTSSNINIEYDYNNERFRYAIKCHFDKSRSWVRIKNSDILAHEQGHFDIAEIHARQLNKYLKAYRFNPKTASKDLNELYDKAMREHRRMQTDYDNETDYSRNKSQQQRWLQKIAAEIKSLNGFADYQQGLQQLH